MGYITLSPKVVVGFRPINPKAEKLSLFPSNICLWQWQWHQCLETGMALTLSTPHIRWLRHHTATKLGISKAGTAFSTPTESPKTHSSVSISASFRASFSSSTESNMPSSAKIIVKGLPLSTSEGRLMKVFSGFGYVTQVKLLIHKESGLSLGSAHIWFVKEESAQLAVKEMNGKFFDGRFIHVKTAKHGSSSRSWKKATPYKF